MPPLAAPAESPSTSSTRTSGRHAESTDRTPLLDGQTLPATALETPDESRGTGGCRSLSVVQRAPGSRLMSAASSAGWVRWGK
ncbi:hypothetical protein DN051_36175 [Streptomyces cadmiisoli]|uniref:Uncharacterized protein n=1 Tax=Streptomyces cadmiisoli TaxID=2184053 RepID=A0A2Z4J8X2_9ACTN|nr:hypothetical protein DN051_36175 [Streptomyces cadmiisoli]